MCPHCPQNCPHAPPAGCCIVCHKSLSSGRPVSLRVRLTLLWAAYQEAWAATQGRIHWSCYQQARREAERLYAALAGEQN